MRIFSILLTFLILSYGGLSQGYAIDNSFKHDRLTIKTKNKTVEFSIEIAETESEKAQGFMHRKHIASNHGMLFIWAHDMPVVMWMKNTPVSLDMLFVDSEGKIAYIEKNTEPFSESIIDPKMQVRAVLEVNAGTSAKKKIKVGDHVLHRFFSDAPQ